MVLIIILIMNYGLWPFMDNGMTYTLGKAVLDKVLSLINE